MGESQGTLVGVAAIFLTVAVVTLYMSNAAEADLVVGHYANSCPTVETIIADSMKNSIASDSTVAPGVLRLAFHDCFVRGCEASVLLDKANSEKTAPINVNLHGFEAIDAAKAAVEKACPGVVSCADILQYAARDAVVLTGGQSWDVFAGRRDGTESNAAEPATELPLQTMTVSQLLSVFALKNLNAAHMVALSGSHSIGVAHCSFVTDRLYPNADSSIPADLLASMKASCPTAAATTQLNLDEQTPNTFDSKYFDNIINNRGLLASDQVLLDDSLTASEVQANNGANFGTKFAQAMVVMARYQVLIDNAGEIRTNCRNTL
ncbi:hypothetical protein KC19_1G228900 [Ceratodon purpureus]|uniref:Peroxidase n=1 Tax=Ceratodon purpureus TaxID=3225 RepID=A0A8T0JAL2_CERPU|nr:hypothetical protein KC19_1G228900 [Ceratodon purpureus]